MRKLSICCVPAQEKWQEESKQNRITVSDNDIADVVSMMTNVPVNKIVKSENLHDPIFEFLYTEPKAWEASSIILNL